MKLWKIKANALRLMFSDYDMSFTQTEFDDGTVLNNNNTREKLVLMNDSVSRAIDRYYTYVGEPTRNATVYLKSTLHDEGLETEWTEFHNELDLSTVSDFGYPVRIDVDLYEESTDVNNNIIKTLRYQYKEIEYVYDPVSKDVLFILDDYTDYGLNAIYRVWYKMDKLNLPDGLGDAETTYDLDTIFIPKEVQRYIPYFVKGELYEEDEPEIAFASMTKYIQFLRELRRPYSKVQKKVRKANIFNK